MFNYTSDADKQWFDHITPYSADNQKGSVQLVSYDQYKGTWNYNLEFTKGKDKSCRQHSCYPDHQGQPG